MDGLCDAPLLLVRDLVQHIVRKGLANDGGSLQNHLLPRLDPVDDRHDQRLQARRRCLPMTRIPLRLRFRNEEVISTW